MDAPGRDRFVDLLRGGSIVAVVVGHWLVADLRWSGAEIVETSSLAEVPAMWPLTWLLVVIPVFFFVGGYANLRSWAGTLRRNEGYATFVDRRVHRVLAPSGLYVAVVAVAGLLADQSGGLGVRGMGGLFYQPLWFLGAYLCVVALVPLTVRAHRRFGVAVPLVLVGLVVLGDLGRFAFEISAAGYANVLVVWLLMHQLGYFYADGTLSRSVAAAMAVGGLAATALAVALGPWSATMVGVTGGEVGNMHPPTLAVTTLGVAQVGIAMLLRDPLTRWVARPRVWSAVVVVNLNVLSIYLWHQAALTIAARVVLPLGYPDPVAGTVGWWAARLAWLVIPGLVLAGIVAVAGRAERVAAPRPIEPGAMTAGAAALGVVLVSVGYLALAGSSATEPFAVGQSLGPFTASPLLGLGMLAAAALLFLALRRFRPGQVARVSSSSVPSSVVPTTDPPRPTSRSRTR
jgi:surface polysaccharide O-acyltransferase-like enzyme